jgi:hypothetical protein
MPIRSAARSLTLLLAALCLPGGAASAQADIAAWTPHVALVFDDSAPDAISRKSMGAMPLRWSFAGAFAARGFAVTDEGAADVKAGEELPSNAARARAMEHGQQALSHVMPSGAPAVVGLNRGHVARRDKGDGHATLLARAGVELIDARTFETVTRVESELQRVQIGADCGDTCQSRAAARALGLAATDMGGRTVAAIADGQSLFSGGGGATGSQATAAGVDAAWRCRGAQATAYTLVFKRLQEGTVDAVVRTLTNGDAPPPAEQFPCFRSYELLARDAGLARYEYVSTASSTELTAWTSAVLEDMGLVPERDVFVSYGEGRLVLDSAEPMPGDRMGGAQSGRDGGQPRFQ